MENKTPYAPWKLDPWADVFCDLCLSTACTNYDCICFGCKKPYWECRSKTMECRIYHAVRIPSLIEFTVCTACNETLRPLYDFCGRPVACMGCNYYPEEDKKHNQK